MLHECWALDACLPLEHDGSTMDCTFQENLLSREGDRHMLTAKNSLSRGGASCPPLLSVLGLVWLGVGGASYPWLLSVLGLVWPELVQVCTDCHTHCSHLQLPHCEQENTLSFQSPTNSASDTISGPSSANILDPWAEGVYYRDKHKVS